MRTLFGFRPSTVFTFLFLLMFMLPILTVAMISDLLTPKEMLFPKDINDPKFREYWDKKNNSWFGRAFNAVSDGWFALMNKLLGL